MKLIENADVLNVFKQYPKPICDKLLVLRQLVIEVALELEDDNFLQETLKWGEPSYQSPNGSTIRMAWKKSSPQQYALYFHCKTKLVDTFKELYPDILHYEGNRAIIFRDTPLDEPSEIDSAELISALRHCITLSLTYHQVKHLPLLGA